MKRIILLLTITLFFVGCKKPEIIMNGDKIYSINIWNGGTFVYLKYKFEGFKFEDAVILEKEFSKWGEEKGIKIASMGRFPDKKNWQLGFMAKEIPEEKEFKGHKIMSLKIPAGNYATLKGKGHPEGIYKYWKTLKETLIADNYAIMSPVFEVYTDILDTTISPENQIGEIKYRILDKLEKPKVLY